MFFHKNSSKKSNLEHFEQSIAERASLKPCSDPKISVNAKTSGPFFSTEALFDLDFIPSEWLILLIYIKKCLKND